MTFVLKFMIVSFISSSAFGWWPFKSEPTLKVSAINACLECAVNAQLGFNYFGLSSQITPGSHSVLLVQKDSASGDDMEASTFQKLQNRIQRFSKNKSGFAAQMVLQLKQLPQVNQKLYFQLALDEDRKTSIFAGRNKPTYETEKEISHELWGYCFNVDNQAYVFINEYQNFWAADYSLVHELAHLYDKASGDYIEKLNSSNTPMGPIDHVALEFRAVLAEVTYRKEVVTSLDFSKFPMVEEDFRDELISEKIVSNTKVLDFVLDLLYPINFKNKTTSQMTATSEKDTDQNRFIFDFVSHFLRESISKMTKKYFVQNAIGLTYRTVDSEQLAQQNRKIRTELDLEARRRGANDLMDYLVKNNLTETPTASSVRQDGKLNPCNGPSPRGGGGSP